MKRPLLIALIWSIAFCKTIARNSFYADDWEWIPPITNEDLRKYNEEVLEIMREKRNKALKKLQETCTTHNPFKRRTWYMSLLQEAKMLDDEECIAIILDFKDHYDCHQELQEILWTLPSELYALFKQKGVDFTGRSSTGLTLLDRKIQEQNEAAIEWLLKNTTIDCNNQDIHGDTSLHHLAQNCGKSVPAYNCPPEYLCDERLIAQEQKILNLLKNKSCQPFFNGRNKKPSYYAQKRACHFKDDKEKCTNCILLAQALKKWEDECEHQYKIEKLS